MKMSAETVTIWIALCSWALSRSSIANSWSSTVSTMGPSTTSNVNLRSKSGWVTALASIAAVVSGERRKTQRVAIRSAGLKLSKDSAIDRPIIPTFEYVEAGFVSSGSSGVACMSPNYQVQQPVAGRSARGHAEAERGETIVARGRALYASPVRCNAELGGAQ